MPLVYSPIPIRRGCLVLSLTYKHTWFQMMTAVIQHCLYAYIALTRFTGGTLDGNGQTWYDLYAADKYILRPVL